MPAARSVHSLLWPIFLGILLTPSASWCSSQSATAAAPVDSRQETGVAGGAQAGGFQGTPWEGEPGVTESVADIIVRENQLERPQVMGPRELKPFLTAPRERLEQNPLSPAVPNWPPSGVQGISEFLPQPYSSQAVGVSFLGAQFSESSAVPPDSMGAFSTSQFLVCVNNRIKVFDK
jgi:hypothetical protein